MPSSHLVSTRPIQHLSRLIKQLGGDINLLCQQVGTHPHAIADMQARLPYNQITLLMELAAQHCNCPDIGLRLADIQQPVNLGALGLLMKSGETLTESFGYLSQFYHLQNQSVKILLLRDDPNAQLVREDLWLEKLPTFQYTTMTFAHCLKAMQMYLGDDWRPDYVTFTYAAPANRSDYDDYFQCPVEFEQPINAIGFPSYYLDINIVAEYASQKDYLQNLVQKLSKSTELSLLQNVQHLTRQLLHTENCTQEYVAQLLEMHPKKLQREIRQAGTCFRDIRAQARLALAEHFLKDTSIPLTTIAEMLGFSELSAFSRAFGHKHQLSPKQWRQHYRALFRPD